MGLFHFLAQFLNPFFEACFYFFTQILIIKQLPTHYNSIYGLSMPIKVILKLPFFQKNSTILKKTQFQNDLNWH